MNIKVGIVGAAGFAGVDLVRLILSHPKFSLECISSDSLAGKNLSAIYPAFHGASDIQFQNHDIENFRDCEVVFLAVPHGASLAITPEFIDAGISVVDLSADYRIEDVSTYEKWYNLQHTSSSLLATRFFGIPELFREDLDASAELYLENQPVLIACAGCYPTATSLAAFPAVNAGWYSENSSLIVNSISGVTGAGKSATQKTHFCFANENLTAYSLGTHRHTPEIEQILGTGQGSVVFSPHLAPLNRGLISTVCIPLTNDTPGLEKIHDFYSLFYSNSPFVEVLPIGVLPQTSSVSGTNNAHIGLAFSTSKKELLAVCVIDNLCKGSASQAVQCANIMCGFEENAGLASIALPI